MGAAGAAVLVLPHAATVNPSSPTMAAIKRVRMLAPPLAIPTRPALVVNKRLSYRMHAWKPCQSEAAASAGDAEGAGGQGQGSPVDSLAGRQPRPPAPHRPGDAGANRGPAAGDGVPAEPCRSWAEAPPDPVPGPRDSRHHQPALR